MTFLTASKAFKPNDVIMILDSTPTQGENPGRIQVDNERYILPSKDIYHSCHPNSYIDWKTMQLKASMEISKNTLVTYHYGTSEDDYSIGAFDCDCGYPDCVKRFRGCKYLTKKQRDKIKNRLSPFLKNKYYGENRF